MTGRERTRYTEAEHRQVDTRDANGVAQRRTETVHVPRNGRKEFFNVRVGWWVGDEGGAACRGQWRGVGQTGIWRGRGPGALLVSS